LEKLPAINRAQKINFFFSFKLMYQIDRFLIFFLNPYRLNFQS